VYVWPALSWTVVKNEKFPVLVGVPEINPDGEAVTPGGNILGGTLAIL